MDVEVAIVGGGLIGAALARALRGLTAAVVAPERPARTAVPPQGFDARVYARVLGCREVTLADETAVSAATGVVPGYLGPIGLKLRVVADHSVQGMRGAVTGANEANAHFIQVDQERDFTPSMFADLRLAVSGDPCPRCEKGKLQTHRGIEVGQVFYLGKKYSEAMGATYLDRSEEHTSEL